jgi:hypothetical protein
VEEFFRDGPGPGHVQDRVRVRAGEPGEDPELPVPQLHVRGGACVGVPGEHAEGAVAGREGVIRGARLL